MRNYHGKRLSNTPGDVKVVVESNWGYCTKCKDIIPELNESGFRHFDKDYQLCESHIEDVNRIYSDLNKRSLTEPRDFEWGKDHTNGSLNLALSILWDVTGERPDPGLVAKFSSKVIQKLNRDNWTLDSYDVRRFLNEQDRRFIRS